MKRDYVLFIKDILDAIEKIEEFVADMSYEEFVEDDKTKSAVIRKFEIIGEATKNVSDEIKEKYPTLPWKEMAGMRDRLIHGYFGIDTKLVWDTIHMQLPELKPKIKKILDEMKEEW